MRPYSLPSRVAVNSEPWVWQNLLLSTLALPASNAGTLSYAMPVAASHRSKFMALPGFLGISGPPFGGLPGGGGGGGVTANFPRQQIRIARPTWGGFVTWGRK